jgi:hypothetical protein
MKGKMLISLSYMDVVEATKELIVLTPKTDYDQTTTSLLSDTSIKVLILSYYGKKIRRNIWLSIGFALISGKWTTFDFEYFLGLVSTKENLILGQDYIQVYYWPKC